MLELLILLPLIMVSILSMTFEVSVDELSNASRGNYFYYDAYSGNQYRSIQDKVHEFYTRMLDESQNKIEVSKRKNSSRRVKWLQGKCEIQAIQTLHRRCQCRKPRKRCVQIESPRSTVVSAMPECAFVERCEGVCPQSSQCKPLTMEMITVPVIYLNLVVTESGSELMPECTKMTLERHLKCGCSCALTQKDCDEDQVFNPSTCRCECHKTQIADDCQKSGKHWDISNCKCVCPPDIPQLCSTGAFFHNELCRCVPVDQPSRRRKPPV